MTVIVGITNGADVYIGGDRSASDGSAIISTVNSKVGTNGPIIYGYCGTIGIGQLIGLIPLPPVNDDPYSYIRLTVVEELKKAIESFSREKDEHDTTWLIGCQGRLFELSQEDWSVAEVYETAVGSGGNFALGSLYTSTMYIPNIEERITNALNAAITYSPMCQAPYDIVHI